MIEPDLTSRSRLKTVLSEAFLVSTELVAVDLQGGASSVVLFYPRNRREQ